MVSHLAPLCTGAHLSLSQRELPFVCQAPVRLVRGGSRATAQVTPRVGPPYSLAIILVNLLFLELDWWTVFRDTIDTEVASTCYAQS